VARGILRAPDGTPPRRVRYTLAPRSRPLIVGLRHLFDQAASSPEEFHIDEDPPTGRVRVRSLPLEPPPPHKKRARVRR
jgi:hypothetical protein